MSDQDTGDVRDTKDAAYAHRLESLQHVGWKRLLRVQAPYHAHIRAMRLGRTLDVGCGIGRNLTHLPAGSIGVDHNAESVALARAAGLEAFTTDEFLARPDLAKVGVYDSMLVAHVVEHLSSDDARMVVATYLDFVRPAGRVVLITPQERGYASDPTHVTFVDLNGLRELCADVGLDVVRQYSFPLPRLVGRTFTYNEFVVHARLPGS